MKKSKFKSVKFKPTDRYLFPKGDNIWRDETYLFEVSFTEQYIQDHPELFEVEKAEREFEEGAYYKAMLASHSVPEIIQRFESRFQRTGSGLDYFETDFYEIGEKIEL